MLGYLKTEWDILGRLEQDRQCILISTYIRIKHSDTASLINSFIIILSEHIFLGDSMKERID